MPQQTLSRQEEQTKAIIKQKMMAHFSYLNIHDIFIRESSYDETVFFVDVIVQDNLDKKYASELAGIVPLIRPDLIENGELRFPVFSFIAQSEAGMKRYA